MAQHKEGTMGRLDDKGRKQGKWLEGELSKEHKHKDGSRGKDGEAYIHTYKDDKVVRSEKAKKWKEGKIHYREKSDGCFITTACAAAKGLPDNCAELNTLRAFRDTYVKSLPEGKRLIHEYYAIAPGIVAAINQEKDARQIWLRLYKRLVSRSISLIQSGSADAAFRNILTIVSELKAKYL